MTDHSKLYSALLKSRALKAESKSEPSSADTEASLAIEESEPDRDYDRPMVQENGTESGEWQQFPKDETRVSSPDWLQLDDDPIITPQEDESIDDGLNGFSAEFKHTDKGWPPSIYDANSALKKILNPRPWTPAQLRRRRIIYSGMPNPSILNAYRELRINLRNRSVGENFAVLMASLSQRPGSVLTAFNLAASFAMDAHSSALLIDCDPHHNELQHLVSTPMQRGITDFVADPELSAMEIIYPSGVNRLSVIPAGRRATSAVELFSSRRMGELMEELQSRYSDRYLIINAPSFRVSAEARILERYVKQTVLTVPFGELTAEDILASVSVMNPEKFAGLVYQE